MYDISDICLKLVASFMCAEWSAEMCRAHIWLPEGERALNIFFKCFLNWKGFNECRSKISRNWSADTLWALSQNDKMPRCQWHTGPSHLDHAHAQFFFWNTNNGSDGIRSEHADVKTFLAVREFVKDNGLACPHWVDFGCKCVTAISAPQFIFRSVVCVPWQRHETCQIWLKESQPFWWSQVPWRLVGRSLCRLRLKWISNQIKLCTGWWSTWFQFQYVSNGGFPSKVFMLTFVIHFFTMRNKILQLKV